jgi:uncharacterized oligopeptide transporter (OPT) family protein
MRDPMPTNISGEKVQRHVFKHEINWGYVAVAVVVLIVAIRLVDADRENTEGDANRRGV